MNSIFGAIYNLLLTCAVIGVLVGCQQAREPEIGSNVVTNKDHSVDQRIGDDTQGYEVIGQDTLNGKLKNGQIKFPSSDAAQRALREQTVAVDASEDNNAAPEVTSRAAIFLGFPIGLLEEHQLFGAVITKVSDAASESLGRLKLSDLTPIHVRPILGKLPTGDMVLILDGCIMNCSETSATSPLINIPVVGVDVAKQLIYLDLGALGSALNLAQMMDPTGAYTKLKTKVSETQLFDYSYSTLVFDIKTTMIPIGTAEADSETAPTTDITARWYLRLASGSNPAFISRKETDDVGFFMTERVKEPKIMRHSLQKTMAQPAAVKYYIKNVPLEFRPAIQAAFDDWNKVFEKELNTKLIHYEFIETTDPRYGILVAGDIRFNILEWDLDNRAPYGGLGPSVANQYTGQIMTSNVLLQGPHIVKLYSEWYKLGPVIAALQESGDIAGANRELMKFEKSIASQSQAMPQLDLRLGTIAFRIPAQMPSFHDPLFQRVDFDNVPVGISYADYMAGYFQEMVAHELGHNLGLRHNFRGNLSDDNSRTEGSVSHSIMEYLGRNYRHLNRISSYDVMAIKYGYAGTQPTVKGSYCTDENVAEASILDASPECSRDDATNDPFSFFENRLTRAIDLLLNRGTDQAPEWTINDMTREFDPIIKGLALYASTSIHTGPFWTNFYGKPGRPTAAPDVKAYVLSRLKLQLCDPALIQMILSKADAVASLKTQRSLDALLKQVDSIVRQVSAFSSAEISCTP